MHLQSLLCWMHIVSLPLYLCAIRIVHNKDEIQDDLSWTVGNLRHIPYCLIVCGSVFLLNIFAHTHKNINKMRALVFTWWDYHYQYDAWRASFGNGENQHTKSASSRFCYLHLTSRNETEIYRVHDKVALSSQKTRVCIVFLVRFNSHNNALGLE